MKISSQACLLALLLTVVICLGTPPGLRAQSKAGWGENQVQALQKARSANKFVLLDFTGSDWCISCRQMDRDVFSTPEFQQYARQHLELVEVDFPLANSLSERVKKQNDELQRKYDVEGFPTIVVLNADGKKIGEFEGYQEGGAKAFIAQLEKLPRS